MDDPFTQLAHAQKLFTEALAVLAVQGKTPSPPLPESVFVTIKTFAGKHAVCTRTVRRWMKLGLPYHRAGKRVIRIPLVEASKFVTEGGLNSLAPRRRNGSAR